MTDLALEVARAITGVVNPEDRWLNKAELAIAAVKNFERNRSISRRMTCPKCEHKWRASIMINRLARQLGHGACCICGELIIKRHPMQNVCHRTICIRKRNSMNHKRWRNEK